MHFGVDSLTQTNTTLQCKPKHSTSKPAKSILAEVGSANRLQTDPSNCLWFDFRIRSPSAFRSSEPRSPSRLPRLFPTRTRPPRAPGHGWESPKALAWSFCSLFLCKCGPLRPISLQGRQGWTKGRTGYLLERLISAVSRDLHSHISRHNVSEAIQSVLAPNKMQPRNWAHQKEVKRPHFLLVGNGGVTLDQSLTTSPCLPLLGKP